jgi:hypothetical protein
MHRFPGIFLVNRMVWNGITRYCFYFCCAAQNSEHFTRPRNSLEQNSESFLFCGTAGINQLFCLARNDFCSGIANPNTYPVVPFTLYIRGSVTAAFKLDTNICVNKPHVFWFMGLPQVSRALQVPWSPS